MSPRRMYLYQYSAQTYWDAMSLRNLFAQFSNTQEGYWASHGAPITLLFETYNETAGADFWYNATKKAPTTAESALSDELRSRIIAFVKTGVPNDSDYTGWQSVERYGSSSSGAATAMGQFAFDLESGGHMQSNEDVAGLFLRCSAFPSYQPFIIVTEAPTVRLRCPLVALDFCSTDDLLFLTEASHETTNRTFTYSFVWMQPSSDDDFHCVHTYSATLLQQSKRAAPIVLAVTSKPIVTVDSIASSIMERAENDPPTGPVDVRTFLQVAQEIINQSVVVTMKHMRMSGE